MAQNNAQLVGAQALGISISVTTVASTSVNMPNKGGTVVITNPGSSEALVSIGEGTQTATVPGTTPVATGCSIVAGASVSFSIPWDKALQISAICATGSTTLRVYVSEGQ